jgi:ABC-type cobalamin/Fe3+-siderophores transport system ATPase subunit
LAGSQAGIAALFIHGPGGIGKRTLLDTFEREAHDARVSTIRLDGREIESSPASFLSAFGAAMAIDADRSPLDALAGLGRLVLLLDTTND